MTRERRYKRLLKAYSLCVEMWEWCAKTGDNKHNWPGWEDRRNDRLIDEAYSPMFCFYCAAHRTCKPCPFVKHYEGCTAKSSPYYEWSYYKWSGDEYSLRKKKAAKEILTFVKLMYENLQKEYEGNV